MRGAVAAVLALAVVLAGGLALAGQDDELWAEALRKERVEGDLKGAVEIYRKLASTSNARSEYRRMKSRRKPELKIIQLGIRISR